MTFLDDFPQKVFFCAGMNSLIRSPDRTVARTRTVPGKAFPRKAFFYVEGRITKIVDKSHAFLLDQYEFVALSDYVIIILEL